MNASIFVLFRFVNTKVLDDLYEEISNLMMESQFVELFKYATTADEHGSLIIDQTHTDPTQRLKLGWERFLSY